MDKDDYLKKLTLCKELYKACNQPADTFKFETNFIEIWTLIEQLNNLEKNIPFCGVNQRQEKNFDEFLKFLKSHESKFDNIIIKKIDESNYGIIANQDFKKADLLFELPKSLIITVKDAFESELEKLITHDKLLVTMHNITLSVYILYIKLCINNNPKSEYQKWKPYFDILPSQFNTPLYFSLDELKLTQPAQCFQNIFLHVRNIARQYSYLVNLLETREGNEYELLKSNLSFQNYRWCVSVVSTRQNQIIDENKHPMLAMIPLLDMCNHFDHPEGQFCTDFDLESNSAKCFAYDDINKGDEIKIYYGNRNNQDLLIHNGFVLEKNRNNSFKLKLGVSLNDKLFHERTEALGKFGLNSNETFEIKVNSDRTIPIGVYVFIKVFQMKTIDELQSIINTRKSFNIEKYFKENNLQSNDQIKSFLKMRLTILLKSYEKNLTELRQENNHEKSNNVLFIKRLLESEYDLIKSTIDLI